MSRRLLAFRKRFGLRSKSKAAELYVEIVEHTSARRVHRKETFSGVDLDGKSYKMVRAFPGKPSQPINDEKARRLAAQLAVLV